LIKLGARRAACVKDDFPALFLPTRKVIPERSRLGHSANFLKFLNPMLFILGRMSIVYACLILTYHRQRYALLAKASFVGITPYAYFAILSRSLVNQSLNCLRNHSSPNSLLIELLRSNIQEDICNSSG